MKHTIISLLVIALPFVFGQWGNNGGGGGRSNGQWNGQMYSKPQLGPGHPPFPPSDPHETQQGFVDPYSDWHYEVKEIKNAPDMSDQGTPLSGGGGGSGMTGGMSGGGMGGGPQRQESQPYQPKPRQPHVYEDNGSPSLEDSQWAKSDYQVQPVNRKRDPGVMAPYKM